MRRRDEITKIALSALFLALAFVLPLLTGQIPEFGNMLLPMHIPIFLCGMICGPQYGAIIGFSAPLLRSLIFGMPVFMPSALAMSFELLTYGLISGLIYRFVRRQNLFTIYLSLIIGMIVGRGVWGIADYILLSLSDTALTWQMFISAVLIESFPGIILQLVFIPVLLEVLNKVGVLRFKDRRKEGGEDERIDG